MNIISTVFPPVLVILGSIGMILLASKFPTTTAMWQLKYWKKRVLFLNGYHLWILSWCLIILGSVIQLLDGVSRLCRQ